MKSHWGFNKIFDDNRMYGYLPREFIEKCTEDEAREYIKKNIG